MPKSIQIKTGDDVEEVEVNSKMLEFYRRETRKKKVTQKGLSKFFSNIVNIRNFII